MTHHPYGPDELDRADPELEGVAHELERYATSQHGQPPPDLVGRIHAAIDAVPDPERHWWTSLLVGPGSWRPVGRMMAAAAVLAIAVLGAVAVGQVIDSVRPDVGTSPQPSPVTRPSESPTPSASPSPTPTPTASPTPTPSVEPSLTVTPTPPPATAVPTASDDDDDDETPEPSESDNSGPGGGGGDD
jgi:hypothetical protein